MEQEKPFSQRVKHTETFNKPKEVYGEDVPIPHKQPPAKLPPPIEHEKPFKPSNPPKRGYNRTLCKFPDYKENPPKELKRKIKEEDKDDPPRFKPTHNHKSRPTPSVATNVRNLKSSFPSAFRRWRQTKLNEV